MPRVLLVEDDSRSERLYRDLLEFDGYDVVVARTEEEAARHFRSGPPDAVLMDVRIPAAPGADAEKPVGLRLCQRLRSEFLFAGVLVLMSAFYAVPEYRNIGLRNGADAFLDKLDSNMWNEVSARLQSARLTKGHPYKADLQVSDSTDIPASEPNHSKLI